jgi:hypothetical protein
VSIRKLSPSGRTTVQPPFHNMLHTLYIKAAFERCCPIIRTVATLMHTISIIRTTSRQSCPDVWTVAILLHVLPYQGSRLDGLDGVAPSSRLMQLSFHIRVCEGNPISCRTLMRVRTCCHDVWTEPTLKCSNLLDTDGHPDRILGSDFSELEFA